MGWCSGLTRRCQKGTKRQSRNYITLVPLPPYAPELDPVERVWLHLKARFLPHRLHDDIVDAACSAWNRLKAETGRMKSLCSYPWIPRAGA